MMGNSRKGQGMKSLKQVIYDLVDAVYLHLDKQRVLRTCNITKIPRSCNRRGGKLSHAEWAHVIGLFQALICDSLGDVNDPTIVDIGCGTGLLQMASDPFLGNQGKYIGLDVQKGDVEFCRSHYNLDLCQFIHTNTKNCMYNPQAEAIRSAWAIKEESADLVTALSVWTHFDEQDAVFYLKEVFRVLKPGKKAIISFFLLDEHYNQELMKPSGADKRRFNRTCYNMWKFSQKTANSDDWYCADWAKVPEEAIGITNGGVSQLLAESGFSLEKSYVGNWKNCPGLYFQDVLILNKPVLKRH
jgi:SAM-dependent methyltransferase